MYHQPSLTLAFPNYLRLLVLYCSLPFFYDATKFTLTQSFIISVFSRSLEVRQAGWTDERDRKTVG